MHTSAWYATCFYLSSANMEIKKYVKEDFERYFGGDPNNVNMVGCLYNEATENTVTRAWIATTLWTLISTTSICTFLKLAHMIMKKLNKTTDKMSRKTCKQQIELLRALIVQTVIPIFVSFLPCLICYYSPAFNLDLGRPINYVEVIALGAFAFCDPVAIVICLPVFRKRVMCWEKQRKRDVLSKIAETTAT
uniref:G_PROTEIN_RECEP_F1_2 domain-containing protein n=1 Tax=Caenorhabditis tropicalis TaxID=1561998 RepID=A0A1I7T223_9PELO